MKMTTAIASLSSESTVFWAERLKWSAEMRLAKLSGIVNAMDENSF